MRNLFNFAKEIKKCVKPKEISQGVNRMEEIIDVFEEKEEGEQAEENITERRLNLNQLFFNPFYCWQLLC